MSLADEIEAFRVRCFKGMHWEADLIDKFTAYMRGVENERLRGAHALARFFDGSTLPDLQFADTSLNKEQGGDWPDPNGDLPPPPAMQNGNGNDGYGYQPPPPPPGYRPMPNGGIPPDYSPNGEYPKVLSRGTQPPQYPARRFK